MVLATQGRRAREDLTSEIEVCGERVKSIDSGKCLGLLVLNDLTWRHQVEKVVKSCNSKQNGLWKCTSILNKGQRKSKAEGIILLRLNYCIELISQGRKADLERLQSVQSKAARWVLQTRKVDWSLRGGLKKLGWMSMAQQAAYVSIKTSMKILHKSEPERLFSLLTEEKDGIRIRKVLNENKFAKLKATTRKAWSYRSLRWLEQMPDSLRRRDVKLKATQKELKQWVKHHVPVRGDRILWGRPLTGDMRRKRRENEVLEEEDREPEPENREEQTPQESNTDAGERQDGGIGTLAAANGSQDPQGYQEMRLVQRRCLVIILLLLGLNQPLERTDKEVSIKRIKRIRRMQSPVQLVKGLWEKEKCGDRRCGGHRGGVGRVKTGEG